MLKTGICSVAELRTAGKLRGFFGGKRLPSITLYEEAAADPDGERLTTEILERFADEHGAYKRTYYDRFPAFENKVLEFLLAHHSPSQRLTVHDLAVSDARTACRFFETVASAFPDVDYTASDGGGEIRIVEVGKAAVTFSSGGEPLEIKWRPFVHSVHKPENFRFYPLNFIHRKIAFQRILPRAKEFLREERNVRTVNLWCPSALKLVKVDSRFHLKQHNLLMPIDVREGVDVLRAMNVLHHGYFTADQMTSVARHFLNAMKEGATLVIGQNQDANSAVSGFVCQKKGNRFELAWRSGETLLECEPYVLGATAG